MTPLQYIQDNISDLDFLSKPEKKILLDIVSNNLQKQTLRVSGGVINKFFCDAVVERKKFTVEISEFNGKYHAWVRCTNLAQGKTVNIAV